MTRKVVSLGAALAFILAFALAGLANVPAPPVNQLTGIPDTEFTHLVEADCRVCHSSGLPDRHHMLYGTAIQTGQCATYNGTCTGAGAEQCQNNADCPTGETCTPGTRACLTDANCTAPENVCNVTGVDCPVGTCAGDGTTPCTIDDDCVPTPGGPCNAAACPGRSGQFCGQPICQGGSAIKDPDADQNGTMDTNYACLSCHMWDGGFQVVRDCLQCHYQALDTPTVHHATPAAQGGQCVVCHGTLVDDPIGCKELMCAPTSGGNRGNPNANVPVIPCTVDGDCPSGQRCAYYGGGLCSVSTTKECITNSDCPAGETCVNSCDDGHVIPTYDPSLVTPERSSHGHICEGTTDFCEVDDDCVAGTCTGATPDPCHVVEDCPTGETCVGGVVCVADEESVLPGNCAHCHNEGLDTASGVDVLNNHDTHHDTGIYKNVLGGSDSAKCAWCHMAGYPHTPYGETAEHIRWCENCHGYEALHNIQVDSPNAANLGTVVVGGEDAGWGHVGRDAGPSDSDCWGCHGFSIAAAPGSGPLTPYLLGSDKVGATAGSDTLLTLVGATLKNVLGSVTWSSDVSMTGADGSVVTLAAQNVTSGELQVTIPGTTEPGNYALRAVKGSSAASNPLVVSVRPEVAVTGSSCNKKKKELTVTGSGFGEKPAGTDEYINLQVNGESVAVTSWSDTQITASVSGCPGNATITVNALMGSATNTSGGGGGPPPKPCKGKNCR